MTITQARIDEFQRIFKKRTGTMISKEEAVETISTLVNYVQAMNVNEDEYNDTATTHD